MENANLITIDFTTPKVVKGTDKVLLRDIWEYLENGKRYADFAKTFLKRFKENTDFGIFNKFVKKSGRGRPTQEHWVTVDAAKAIAMMSQTPKGDEVRAYFLECERLVYESNLETKLPSIPEFVTPEFFRAMADRLEEETNRAEAAEAEVKELKTNPLTLVEDNCITSVNILKEFPQIRPHAEKMLEQLNCKEPKFGVSAAVTVLLDQELLKLDKGYEKISRRTKSGNHQRVFNRGDVLEVINLLL